MNPSFHALTAPERARLAEAFSLLRAGKAGEAGRLAEELAREVPGHPEVDYLRAEVASAEGDGPRAVRHLRDATRAAPGQWILLLKLARLLLGLRERNAFRRVAAEAAQAAGDDPEGLFAIARAWLAADQPAAAVPLLLRAIATPMGAGHAALWQELGLARFFLGAVDEAEVCIERALSLSGNLPAALHLRSVLRRQRQDAHHVDDLQRRLDATDDPELRVALLFALSKELEDLGDHPASFKALSRGAALKASRSTPALDAELATMRRIGECHTASTLKAMGPGADVEGPLFIIGMPRSGTTLLERMLGRVPGVVPAGELLDLKLVLEAAVRTSRASWPGVDPVEAILGMDAATIGADYLRGAREAVDGGRWWIDKTPVNFLYVGLIRQCLPRARILHLTRQPMDACFAVYKTLFGQAYPFSYRLDTLGDYYIAYRRLMAHWCREFPAQILDVPYERLVTQTEAVAREVLLFCGLPWEEAVLQPELNRAASSTASAAQVREPIHARSVGAWRRHAAALEPLRRRLEDAGLVDADGNAV